MSGVLQSLIAGLILTVVAFLVRRGVAAIRRRRRFGHLYAMAAKARTIQIVVSAFDVRTFAAGGGRARIPSNVPVTPMAEGIAIAELVRTFHSLGHHDVRLVMHEHYHDDCDFTVVIGGPSINSVSGRILTASFPEFVLEYPAHIARYGSTTFRPKKAPSGNLLEDYGFIFVTRTAHGNRCVVLCGVWAVGTQIAATAFLNLDGGSESRRLIARNRDFLAVAHAEIDGLEPLAPDVRSVYQPRMSTRPGSVPAVAGRTGGTSR